MKPAEDHQAQEGAGRNGVRIAGISCPEALLLSSSGSMVLVKQFGRDELVVDRHEVVVLRAIQDV